MKKSVIGIALVLVAALALLLGPVQSKASESDFIFGLLMVGPANDHGSQEWHRARALRRVERGLAPGRKPTRPFSGRNLHLVSPCRALENWRDPPPFRSILS